MNPGDAGKSEEQASSSKSKGRARGASMCSDLKRVAPDVMCDHALQLLGTISPIKCSVDSSHSLFVLFLGAFGGFGERRYACPLSTCSPTHACLCSSNYCAL